jgi:hypothetical protein
VEQFLALYALMGLLDMLGLLVCFLPLFRTLWFGMEDYRLVVYREVGERIIFLIGNKYLIGLTIDILLAKEQ